MDEQMKEKADRDAQRVHQLEKEKHEAATKHRIEIDNLAQKIEDLSRRTTHEIETRDQRIDELMKQCEVLEAEEKRATRTAARFLAVVNDLTSGWGEDE